MKLIHKYIISNIFFNERSSSEKSSSSSNYLDPLLMNLAKGDFRIKSDTPLKRITKGFVGYDGLYELVK